MTWDIDQDAEVTAILKEAFITAANPDNCRGWGNLRHAVMRFKDANPGWQALLFPTIPPPAVKIEPVRRADIEAIRVADRELGYVEELYNEALKDDTLFHLSLRRPGNPMDKTVALTGETGRMLLEILLREGRAEMRKLGVRP